MTVRREIAVQGTCFGFRVSGFGLFGCVLQKLETRNPQLETRNSILQRSGSAIAAEVFMNNAG
jgi:hypothetical protein